MYYSMNSHHTTMGFTYKDNLQNTVTFPQETLKPQVPLEGVISICFCGALSWLYPHVVQGEASILNIDLIIRSGVLD